jgi:hypothetical protein
LLLLGVVTLFISPPSLLARDPHEQARIDFLLHRVETSTGITFIRNGAEHDARAAAAHLREKLGYVGGRITTAEDFIKYCASESSLTHQKYKIRLADKSVVDAADYFRAELRKFDETRQ